MKKLVVMIQSMICIECVCLGECGGLSENAWISKCYLNSETALFHIDGEIVTRQYPCFSI